jgi:hypothetical protein
MADNLKEVNLVLQKFRDYVIQQSRSNLTKGRTPYGSYKNSGELYKSINGEVVTDDKFSIVGFSMLEYGQFIDQGVRGKTSSAKAPNSPFKFGSGGVKGGLTNSIKKWVKEKNIQFHIRKSGKGGKGGTFMTHEQTALLITRSIFHKGIKASLFFTKPFEAGYKKYIDVDLIKAFGQDVETMIDYNLK